MAEPSQGDQRESVPAANRPAVAGNRRPGSGNGSGSMTVIADVRGWHVGAAFRGPSRPKPTLAANWLMHARRHARDYEWLVQPSGISLEASISVPPCGCTTRQGLGLPTTCRSTRGDEQQIPLAMVRRCHRSNSSKSPSTAQNLRGSPVFGARCWGTSYRRSRRDLPLGRTTIARCRQRSRSPTSHAVIPRVWARACSSSAFPKAKGCPVNNLR